MSIDQYSTKIEVDAEKSVLRDIFPETSPVKYTTIYIDHTEKLTFTGYHSDQVKNLLTLIKTHFPSRFGHVTYTYQKRDLDYIGIANGYYYISENGDFGSKIHVTSYSEEGHKKAVERVKEALKEKGIRVKGGKCLVQFTEEC